MVLKASFLRGRGWFMLAAAVGLSLAVAKVSQAPAQGKKGDAAKKEPAESKFVPDILVDGRGAEQVGFINEKIEQAWKDNKLTPSDRCTDFEFIRRASLDIIGRIAKVHEIEQFLKDPPRERRSRLIERLLASEEYSANFANIWTVILMTRAGSSKMYQDQMRDWLDYQFKDKDADWSKIATELISATGETNKNGAVNYVLAHLGENAPGGTGDAGKYDMVPVTSRTTRIFLGLRTQCVQCHDHPFNGEWGQHHFWGINAFFRQVDTSGRPTIGKKKKGQLNQQYTVSDNTSFNSKGIVSYERRSGVLLYTDATFLTGKKMVLKKQDSTRRKELAKFIVNDPYFAKAYVNRTWAHFFGRGLTKDMIDDFGEHNVVVHPEILEKISDDWAKKYAHNPRDLIRWICNSRAYGLSSTATKDNDKQDDEVFFVRMLLKAMSPEQLFESLMVATQAKVGQSKEARVEIKEEWLNKLIANFGDDEGNEVTYSGTVIQALLLMNGQDINNAIMDQKDGTVAAVLKKRAFSQTAAKDAMKDLFLAALNRPPTPAEYAKILSPKTFTMPKAPSRDPATFWTGFYQDVFWAILNSNEFILNH